MIGAKDFGMDLGTDFIRIYVPGSNIVIEPNLVVYHRNTQRIAAVGTRAERLLQADPERYVQYELKDRGEFHDYSTVLDTLVYWVHQNQPFSFLLHPDLLMAIPHGSTIIERKAMKDLCVQAGFHDKGLYFVDELVASAIGSGLPIQDAIGSMVINIGAGNTQAGVFSLGGLVSGGAIHIGGRELDRQIVEHIRKTYDILIDISAAEKAKMQIGSLLPWQMGEIDQVTLEGRSLRTGLPDSVVVTTTEMREAILPAVSEMMNCIIEVLENTPPEIAADLLESGITAVGGGIQMRGLKEMLEERTGLKIHVSDRPTEAVIMGVQKIMQDPKAWSGIFSELLQ